VALPERAGPSLRDTGPDTASCTPGRPCRLPLLPRMAPVRHEPAGRALPLARRAVALNAKRRPDARPDRCPQQHRSVVEVPRCRRPHLAGTTGPTRPRPTRTRLPVLRQPAPVGNEPARRSAPRHRRAVASDPQRQRHASRCFRDHARSALVEVSGRSRPRVERTGHLADPQWPGLRLLREPAPIRHQQCRGPGRQVAATVRHQAEPRTRRAHTGQHQGRGPLAVSRG